MTVQEREYFQKLINAQFDHIRSDIGGLKEDTSKILDQTKLIDDRTRNLELWRATISGEHQATSEGKNKTDWWLVFIVSTLVSVGTIVATKLWH